VFTLGHNCEKFFATLAFLTNFFPPHRVLFAFRQSLSIPVSHTFKSILCDWRHVICSLDRNKLTPSNCVHSGSGLFEASRNIYCLSLRYPLSECCLLAKTCLHQFLNYVYQHVETQSHNMCLQEIRKTCELFGRFWEKSPLQVQRFFSQAGLRLKFVVTFRLFDDNEDDGMNVKPTVTSFVKKTLRCFVKITFHYLFECSPKLAWWSLRNAQT